MTINKKLALSLGVIVIIGAAGVAYFQNQDNQARGYRNPRVPAGGTSASLESLNPSAGASASSTSKTYTMAEVAQHNSASSCWTAINGGVYDVTSWITKHPGGQQAILGLCGIDGSEVFNGQHGGQARPASELASFKIGTLAQ